MCWPFKGPLINNEDCLGLDLVEVQLFVQLLVVVFCWWWWILDVTKHTMFLGLSSQRLINSVDHSRQDYILLPHFWVHLYGVLADDFFSDWVETLFLLWSSTIQIVEVAEIIMAKQLWGTRFFSAAAMVLALLADSIILAKSVGAMVQKSGMVGWISSPSACTCGMGAACGCRHSNWSYPSCIRNS